MNEIEVANLELEDAVLLSLLFNGRRETVQIDQYHRINEFLKRVIEATGTRKDYEGLVCPECDHGFAFDFQTKRVTCKCPSASTWDACEHEWREVEGDCPDFCVMVKCIKCQCPGQRDHSAGGKVFWPAT